MPTPPTIASYGEFRSARRRISPGHGPLLNSVDNAVDLAVDGRNMALGLLQQGVAGGAVVARIGDASLPREIGHCADFAPDSGDKCGIDCRNRIRSESGPLLRFPPLLRAGELGDCRVHDPIFQIAKVFAGGIGVLDNRDKRRFLSKTCETRASSRIRSKETARIASSRTDRKISRARIDKLGISLIPRRPYGPGLRPSQARKPQKTLGQAVWNFAHSLVRPARIITYSARR